MQWIKGRKTTSRILDYKIRWEECTRCSLCKERRTTVLFRGFVPAQILFIGEAPGTFEDLTGYPFVGPAGDLLTYILDESLSIEDFSYCICNTVACFPPWREPTLLEQKACRPRFFDLLDIVKPKVIVSIGEVAREFLNPMTTQKHEQTLREMPRSHIMHPAAILRMSEELRTPQIRRCISTIINTVEEHLR
jgi:DNA polymerase